MREKIVVHLKDGQVFRGHSSDFESGAKDFTLVSLDRPVASSRRLEVDGLKAAFFVRTWGRKEGHILRQYQFAVGGMNEEPGRRVLVSFRDGERMWGYALEDPGPAGGFYLQPADSDGNNLKVFVVNSSLLELQHLPSQAATH